MSLLSNNRINFDYEILEKTEAGIELLGYEVKSLRASKGSLQGSYVILRKKGQKYQAVLMNAFIPPYQEKNTPTDYDPYRPRNILLKQKEMKKWSDQENSGNKKGSSGLTIVPISLYNNKRVIKIELALVRGKKTKDKRETIKRRESDREIAREWKTR